jgi:hypothetical protein
MFTLTRARSPWRSRLASSVPELRPGHLADVAGSHGGAVARRAKIRRKGLVASARRAIYAVPSWVICALLSLADTAGRSLSCR